MVQLIIASGLSVLSGSGPIQLLQEVRISVENSGSIIPKHPHDFPDDHLEDEIHDNPLTVSPSFMAFVLQRPPTCNLCPALVSQISGRIQWISPIPTPIATLNLQNVDPDPMDHLLAPFIDPENQLPNSVGSVDSPALGHLLAPINEKNSGQCVLGPVLMSSRSV